jgi:hypothetical protein
MFDFPVALYFSEEFYAAAIQTPNCDFLDLSVKADDDLHANGFDINCSLYTEDNVTEELSDVEPLIERTNTWTFRRYSTLR